MDANPLRTLIFRGFFEWEILFCRKSPVENGPKIGIKFAQ
jgi:hypothetical protein